MCASLIDEIGVGKGDLVINRVTFLFLKNYSLVIGLDETCCCTTWRV